MEYYTYGYPKEVPLISYWNRLRNGSCDVDIENTINNAIMNVMPRFENNFTQVNEHIDDAKEEILAGCDGCGRSSVDCGCCVATKCDIGRAIEQINSHIDAKFDEVGFTEQFMNINQMVNQLLNNN